MVSAGGLGPSCTSSGSAVGATVAAALHFFAASQCLIQEPWPRHTLPPNGSSYDFIVVGGGTGGATLAARLAQVSSFTVLLVEAGPDPPQESIIPAFRQSLLRSPFDWNFTSVNDNNSSHGLNGRRQLQPRGRMLGGSGSINDMIYARGFPADYEEWAALAGDDWNWTNVLEFFKKTEKLTDERIINNEELMKYHSVTGEIEVSGASDIPFTTDRFLEAFKEIGFNVVDDMTYPHKIGAGRFSHTVRDSRRDSSLTALLNKLTGDNLIVLKNSLATGLITDDLTAVGVKVISNEQEFQFYASKEVILSAGTFNTPKLLMLSGIGPKSHLEDLGIEVVQDLPVGDNLHDHVMFLNYFVADNGTCAITDADQYKDMIKYLYDGSGTLARCDSMGALFALNGTDPNIPDFAFYPTCLPIGSNFYKGCLEVIGFAKDICVQLDTENQNLELFTVAVVLLKPTSRGKVRLKSVNPADAPLIFSGTFNDEGDLAGFPEAVDIVQSMAKTRYFKEKSARVLDIKIKVCEGLSGAEKVKCKARHMATSAWHSVGTAAMGSVVDSDLRVKGVRGLRIADASVIAIVPRANTNAPVVMIAEKAADFIKKTYGVE